MDTIQKSAHIPVYGHTCNFEALYIGIVKFIFTGPASFVIFPTFHKGECHGKLPNRKLHDIARSRYKLCFKQNMYHETPGKMSALHEGCAQNHQQSVV